MFDLLKKSVAENETDNAPAKPRLITLKEAAKLVDGLTEYRLRQLCNSGELKHHKFGKKYMISDQVLLKYFSA